VSGDSKMTTGYYGIITHDTPRGGEHRRLWESDTYTNRMYAVIATANEIVSGKYDGIVGVSWVVTETEGQ